MPDVVFQEEDYEYKGVKFTLKVIRTQEGLEVRSFKGEEEYPKGAVKLGVYMEVSLRNTRKFDDIYNTSLNSDHWLRCKTC